MTNSDFVQWFQSITGHDAPRPWQSELVEESICRPRVIRIPTGLGKTVGVLAAWSFHRLQKRNGDWPCRLVWCLPMRVLVEQTVEEAQKLASRMHELVRPTIHVAMGGEDSSEWFLYPERPAVIIGTQDMLLSRALNRGYASGRARWPTEFGLLNQDALWVMDEVQLMDVGLATSAQLQSFRDDDATKHLRPCKTWWMSATLQPEWLRSVDTANHHPAWVKSPCSVPPATRSGCLWDIPKTVATCAIEHDDHREFAKQIIAAHGALDDGEFGKVTLVVCNTVQRACKTFDALRNAGRSAGLELVHSRFRPAEREGWRSRFLSREACAPGVDTLLSNWAYMVTASLAWSLKAWMALALPEGGRDAEERRAEKYKLLRMEFTTFRRAFMAVPAQIISTGRRIVFRLLSWNPWQHVFFRLLDQLRTPLRC